MSDRKTEPAQPASTGHNELAVEDLELTADVADAVTGGVTEIVVTKTADPSTPTVLR